MILNKKAWIRIGLLSAMALTFMGLALVNNYVINKYKNTLYVKNLLKEPTQAVYSEIQTNQEESATIIPPFVGDDVSLAIDFYDKDAEESVQQKSIIHYESTYLPSTGLLFTSDETFDVIAVYDGEIISVDDDKILGKNIVIKHNDNLITSYYSLDNVVLNPGDKVMQGQIIGSATKNKISSDKNCLFFEVTYQNETINPNIIINQKLTNFL